MRFNKLHDWLDWFEQEHPSKIDRGLERISSVAQKLGLLENKQFVITIAGTNGKGSSVSLFESIFYAAGITTGSYTSPHIHRYNERIRLSGRPVSDTQILSAFNAIDKARGRISLSYFEFSTLAALYIIRENTVDVTLLEVGLGGRLDAVNIIDADIALITNISLDHTQWLGNSVEEIAPEKAAIARNGRPTVISDPDSPDALNIALDKIGARVFQARQAYEYTQQQEGWNWRRVSTGHNYNLPLPALQGQHQIENAAGVIMALQLLPQALKVEENAIQSGLRQMVLAGRQEMLNINGRRILLDVAHNEESAQQLKQRLKAEKVTGRIVAVMGIMEDKAVQTFITVIQEYINEWFVSRAETGRAMSSGELLKIIKKTSVNQNVTDYSSLIIAWESALISTNSNDLVVVTGSFYTVAEIRQKLIESQHVTE